MIILIFLKNEKTKEEPQLCGIKSFLVFNQNILFLLYEEDVLYVLLTLMNNICVIFFYFSKIDYFFLYVSRLFCIDTSIERKIRKKK